MSAGRRARADQVAQRINSAAALLSRGAGLDEATQELIRRYRLSPRQARRYVDRAHAAGGEVSVPEAKIVFTVKLSRGLVRRVRTHAHRQGETISAVVAQALLAFLDRWRSDRGGP